MDQKQRKKREFGGNRDNARNRKKLPSNHS